MERACGDAREENSARARVRVRVCVRLPTSPHAGDGPSTSRCAAPL
jgi:hypothetical protein